VATTSCTVSTERRIIMKEITRIITVEMTEIRKVDDDFIPNDKNAASNAIKSDILEIFDIDNVNVTSVQDFVRDSGGLL
jgi:hypothetical protein